MQVNDPANPAKKIDDYWTPSQALLGEPGFMQRLQEYDKDNISPSIVTALRWVAGWKAQLLGALGAHVNGPSLSQHARAPALPSAI